MRWSEFIGQEPIVSELEIILSSRIPLPHILFYGGWGMGKTTLARLVANSIGTHSYNVGTQKNPIFPDYFPVHIIDEIHSLSRPEKLYPIMENKIFIGCTTNIGKMDLPLRSRFVEFTFLDYSEEEIEKIIKVATKNHYKQLDGESLQEIAQRSRGVPRTAINLAFRVIRFLEVNKLEPNEEVIDKICNYYGIDEIGLTPQDREYLSVLKNAERPIGLKTLSSMSGLDINTITLVIEPFLLKLGFIIVTSSGRILSGHVYTEDKII